MFHSHPHLCPKGGRYVVDRPSAVIAGDEAIETLPEDLCENERPDPDELDATSEFETELSIIADDMKSFVFEGERDTQPEEPPAYEVT